MKLYAGRRRRIATSIGAVVLALALVPVLAQGFKSGTYSGDTSQGQSLQLKVNKAKTKVTVVFFEFVAPPCGGMGGLQYAGLTGKLRNSGKFRVLSPADGYYGYVKGKFEHHSADGTALYHYDPSGCNSGEVTWTAERSSPD